MKKAGMSFIKGQQRQRDDLSMPGLAERDDSTVSLMDTEDKYLSDENTIANSSSDSSNSSGMSDLMVYMESEDSSISSEDVSEMVFYSEEDSSFSSEEASEMMASSESYNDDSTESSESSGEVAERIIILNWDQVVRPTTQETDELSIPPLSEIMCVMNEYQTEPVDVLRMYTGEDIEDGNPYMLEEDPEVLRD